MNNNRIAIIIQPSSVGNRKSKLSLQWFMGNFCISENAFPRLLKKNKKQYKVIHDFIHTISWWYKMKARFKNKNKKAIHMKIWIHLYILHLNIIYVSVYVYIHVPFVYVYMHTNTSHVTFLQWKNRMSFNIIWAKWALFFLAN